MVSTVQSYAFTRENPLRFADGRMRKRVTLNAYFFAALTGTSGVGGF